MAERNALEALVKAMPFAARAGIEVLSAEPGEVRGRMPWSTDLCTTGGSLHGAAVVMLGDTLGAICAFLNLPPNTGTTTIESKTNFFRALREGELVGTVRPLHVGRTVIVVQTDLVDARGRRVAQVTQTQVILAVS